MLYQLILLVITYFDYEIMTRFEVQQIISMPEIIILIKSENTLRMAKQILDIYPEYRGVRPSRLVKSYAMEILKRKLLSDYKLNEFERIVGPEEMFRTCHLMINNKVHNFSKEDLGVVNFAGQLYLFKHLNYSLIDKNKIERITIKTLNSDEFSVQLEPFNINNHIFETNKQFRKKVSFSTFLTQKVSSFKRKCISQENKEDSGEKYYKFCLKECYFKESNDIYGCFLSNQIYVYIEKDIKRNRHKLCNESFDGFSAFSPLTIFKKCKNKCKPNCNFINFDFKLEVSKHISNESILELIPKKTPLIAYIETFKTDFDRLIYNCGGIFGLWFGLTPVKTVDLIQGLSSIFNIFRENIVKIIQYLLTIFKRWIICIIALSMRFVRKLFANSSVFPFN
jgi:hypothetical protein